MRSIFSRIRFLPITIFAAVLLLTVKVNNITQGFDGYGLSGGQPLEIASAAAQNSPTDEPTSLGLTPDDPFEDDGEDPSYNEEDGDYDADLAARAAKLLVSQDPTLLTQAEIELLQQLSERREELDTREREIEQRAGLLSAAEERINEKIRQLQLFKETIEGLVQSYDDQQQQKLISLVKIYESMKPKDAARIFEDLDMDTLLSVAERMKERKLSDIMSKMQPAKARDVTVELSRLRELPERGSIDGG